MSSSLNSVKRVIECIVAAAVYTVGGVFAAMIAAMFLAKGDPDGVMRAILFGGIFLSPVIFLIIAPLYYFSKMFRRILVSLAALLLLVFAGILIYGRLTH